MSLSEDLRAEATKMRQQATATRAAHNAAELRRRAALMVRAAETIDHHDEPSAS